MPQPYQILFPIGALYAIWGALVWILFLAGLTAYPGRAHAHWMIGGFLFSFALGFLMTAIPRFVGAKTATLPELVVGILLALASFPLMIFPVGTPYGHWVALGILLFLVFFASRRFLKREHSPPPSFVFLPVGILLGISGALLMIQGDLASVGRVFLYQGTMLSFVLGVGGKLVTALLGHSDSPLIQITSFNAAAKSQSRISRLVRSSPNWQALLLVIGFLMELGEFRQLGRILRALVAAWVGFGSWKLYRLPKIKTRLAFWLWVAAWGVVLGTGVYGFDPATGIHGLHLMFISGFGLMTFFVATRVTLAHGGYGMELEQRSKALLAIGLLILLASLTRFSMAWSPAYWSHVAYAAGVWILAVLTWLWVFLPRIFRMGHS